MGPTQVVQLDPVLEHAQRAVADGQPGRVVTADVPAGGQGGEGVKGGGAAQRGVGPAVHQLKQLDRELHVPKPAGSELDLAFRLRRRDVLLHPATVSYTHLTLPTIL